MLLLDVVKVQSFHFTCNVFTFNRHLTISFSLN
uniref:Uncharacterized protein n=1 Tax=Siphoviridae sp. ctxc31 TaxID=2826520 RepID=A0A8S5MNE5_9CAUD|nr:MAG TPA: hypothetical protein [Siphoviridae sp. ctxc31]